jgi:hypothetical protein
MIHSYFLTLSLGSAIAFTAGLPPPEQKPASSSAPAPELYDLRGPKPEKGQVFAITGRSKTKDAKLTTKVRDNVRVETFDKTTSEKTEVEVLAVDGFEIAKMRTKIIQDQQEKIARGRGGRGGRRQQEPVKSGELEGQYVYSVHTKIGWRNSLEDALPTEEQTNALKEYVPFKEEDVFYPKEKVKVGHEWKIEPAALQRVFGADLDIKGSGTGKFLRVENEQGEALAVIELQMEFAGKSKDESGTFETKRKEKKTVYRSLKYGFDRKSTTEFTSSSKYAEMVENQKFERQYDGTSNEEEHVDLSTRR